MKIKLKWKITKIDTSSIRTSVMYCFMRYSINNN